MHVYITVIYHNIPLCVLDLSKLSCKCIFVETQIGDLHKAAISQQHQDQWTEQTAVKG